MKKLFVVAGLIAFCAGCMVSQKEMAMREDRAVTPSAPREMEPSEPELATPEKYALSAAPGHVDIFLDCGQSRLGAYHVQLHYDPAVVRVARIETPGGSIITAAPMSKPETYLSGATGVIGLFPGGTGPKGRIAVARVCFEPSGPGKSRLSVSIKSIYDADSKSITGVAILSSDEIVVGR